MPHPQGCEAPLTAEDRQRLVLDHQGIVHEIAAKFGRMHDEDIISVGMVGLARAADQFDQSRNCEFSTYAYPSVLNAIGNHFRTARRPKRGQSREHVGGSSVYEVTGGDSPDQIAMHREAISGIVSLLESLRASHPREAMVVSAFYGVGCEKLTVVEIGSMLGVTKQRAQQIVKKGEKLMRELHLNSSGENT